MAEGLLKYYEENQCYDYDVCSTDQNYQDDSELIQAALTNDSEYMKKQSSKDNNRKMRGDEAQTNSAKRRPRHSLHNSEKSQARYY